MKGLTEDQAIERFSCEICKLSGGCQEDYQHSYDCVMSATCSFLCKHCKERVYFPDDRKDVPENFICPYCGKTN